MGSRGSKGGMGDGGRLDHKTLINSSTVITEAVLLLLGIGEANTINETSTILPLSSRAAAAGKGRLWRGKSGRYVDQDAQAAAKGTKTAACLRRRAEISRRGGEKRAKMDQIN